MARAAHLLIYWKCVGHSKAPKGNPLIGLILNIPLLPELLLLYFYYRGRFHFILFMFLEVAGQKMGLLLNLLRSPLDEEKEPPL